MVWVFFVKDLDVVDEKVFDIFEVDLNLILNVLINFFIKFSVCGVIWVVVIVRRLKLF